MKHRSYWISFFPRVIVNNGTGIQKTDYCQRFNWFPKAGPGKAELMKDLDQADPPSHQSVRKPLWRVKYEIWNVKISLGKYRKHLSCKLWKNIGSDKRYREGTTLKSLIIWWKVSERRSKPSLESLGRLKQNTGTTQKRQLTKLQPKLSKNEHPRQRKWPHRNVLRKWITE